MFAGIAGILTQTGAQFAITAAQVNSWFTPFHYIVYLGVLVVGMVVYYQWKWSKVCKENIQLLVARTGGGGDFMLAKKDGGQVTLENKESGVTRTWMINELATIDVLYPGVGIIPAFLQKTIRMAILNEGDWEPMLNRSPHRENIASPDVVAFLQELAVDEPKLKSRIEQVVGKLSTGPTRELIADPALIGALRQSTIMKALATVSNDLMETLKTISQKLERKADQINPLVFYVALLVLVAGLGFAIYQGIQNTESLQRIKDALGIVPVPPVTPP